MKVILGSGKHHYVVRASIFLITAALVWAMMGCTEVYPTEYKLTIPRATGGSVVIPGEGTYRYAEGTSVVLVATPDEGYRFVKWDGDVRTIGNVTKAQTQIKVRGEYSITAIFEKIPVYNLTVSTTVGGVVVKPGPGNFTYNGGRMVKLEAHENVGYGFVNWTGDVSGIADVNAAATTITMDGNYSIRANFEEEAAVNITDTNVEAAIRAGSGIRERAIYPSDLKRLTSLEAEAKNVSDITALEYCTGLTKLYLYDNQIDGISPLANLTSLRELNLSANQISDISPLANLTSLRELYLSANRISNISPLASLTSLTYLYLSGNQISDISPLASLTSLTYLYLSGNQISDISPLASLTRQLTDLSLGGNQISDISPLASLTNLTFLNLSNNQISDIDALVDNLGLSQGDRVYLYNNPLSYSPLSYSYVSTYIAQLEVRGVIVEY
jgi:Leucine-rich repeat (LRR) protein